MVSWIDRPDGTVGRRQMAPWPDGPDAAVGRGQMPLHFWQTVTVFENCMVGMSAKIDSWLKGLSNTHSDMQVGDSSSSIDF